MQFVSHGSRQRISALFVGAIFLIAIADDVKAQSAQPSSREVTVRAAGFYKSGNECGGSTSPVYIQAGPNPLGKIQFGFFESSAGAIGPQSKASGWLAALVSTELLNEDLRKYRISISRTDLIDGPSAGGLMTSGLVALLRGDGFPDDVSMTGIINPDGTIGPVGGIAHKILGASQAGIKRFAIPQGQKEDYNLCAGESEDVIAVGKALGIEVAEVGNIREAYHFLTGVELPRPPNAPVPMEIPDEIRAGFRDLYTAWFDRYLAARQFVAGAQQADFPNELRQIWAHGEALLQSADREFKSGHEPAAFNRLWMAVLNAEFIAKGVTAMSALRSSGFPGLHDIADKEIETTQDDLSRKLSEFKNIKITSVTDAGAIAAMGSHLATGFAFLEQAEVELGASKALAKNTSTPDPAETVLLSFEALSHATLAQLLFDAAQLDANWIGRDGQAWQGRDDPIIAALELYDSAARSNIRYVDVLYTDGVAEKRQMDTKSAREWIKRKDPVYLSAVGGLNQQYKLYNLFVDFDVADLARLGALMNTIANASLLVAQQYSIGVEKDELGRIVDIYDLPALERMLALADQAAVEAISEAGQSTMGASSPMLVVALDAARRNRDESISAQDQFTALSIFWTTTLHARLITRLASSK